MTDDEILAAAMEVFNRSMQTGLPDSSATGQQQAGTQDQPASGMDGATGQSSSTADGHTSEDAAGDNTSGVVDGEGIQTAEGMETDQPDSGASGAQAADTRGTQGEMSGSYDSANGTTHEQGGKDQSAGTGDIAAGVGTDQANGSGGSSGGQMSAGTDTGIGTSGTFGATVYGTGAADGGTGDGRMSEATSSGSGVYVTGVPGRDQTGGFPQGSGQRGGTHDDLSDRRIIVIGTGSGVLTEQERVGGLERQLEEQLGVFDGIILARRQEAIATSNEQGAGNIPASSGGFGNDDGAGTAPLLTASRDPNNMQTRGQLPTGATSDYRSGDYRNQELDNSNIPDDISDGSDDDIVARQLREAATQEQDPELRDKLWDEYRKYKAGVQASR